MCFWSLNYKRNFIFCKNVSRTKEYMYIQSKPQEITAYDSILYSMHTVYHQHYSTFCSSLFFPGSYSVQFILYTVTYII